MSCRIGVLLLPLLTTLGLLPITAGAQPRFVWVRSAEGKSRLAALAAPTNAPKILAAPVTVIVGHDLDFAEQLPKLFPARAKDTQAYFSDPLVAETTAFRNGSLQGALFQACGLCCNMTGKPSSAPDLRLVGRLQLVPRRSDYDSLSWASRVAAAGSG
jgi:nitroreductase